jgi:hypothetical protein
LRIRDVYPVSNFSVPDPESKRFRIPDPDPHKKTGCSFRIRIAIRIQGAKAPDPGSGSATWFDHHKHLFYQCKIFEIISLKYNNIGDLEILNDTIPTA